MALILYTRQIGVITYILILLAIISGVRHWNIKHHRILASLALVSASIHAAIVFFGL